MTWTPPAREPWAERLIQIGRNLGDDGRSLIALDAPSLIAAAEAATELRDWGDETFRQPLDVLCRAFDEEARLHLLGRLFARTEVQRILQNRLRVNAWRTAHPEVADQRIERPIFITGLGRSGTTLLHELLAQDPGNRVPLLGELFFPVPPPEPGGEASDARLEAAGDEITLMDAAVPAMTAMHENAGDRPNECIFLFAHELVTDLFTGQFHVPSYTMWVSGADRSRAYQSHRRLLQHLQSRDPQARWVLKAPSHLSQLPDLFAEYPDARVVWAHRDPLRVVGSLCNLTAALHWMRSDHVDYEAIVTTMAFGLLYLSDRVTQQRDEGAIPEDRISDVLYSELVRDPIECVRSLYSGWGESLSDGAEENMRRWLARRRPGGPHEYDFAATGLDPRAERERVAGYQQRYGVISEV